MAVGVLRLNLYLPNVNSLKEKRSVVKRFLSQIRKEFNVAAAETDHNDKWRHCIIEVAAVSNSRTHLEKILRNVLEFTEQTLLHEVADYALEVY